MESLTAAEVTAAGHRVLEISKRQLIVEGLALVQEPPRLADDLFVVHTALPDPGHRKTDLLATARAFRFETALGERRGFAVTASFVGERNFNRFDVEDLVGSALGGRYYSRRDGQTPPADRDDWRVVLDGKTLWVARRPYDVPLHRRPWRQQTVVGSLHPPVAAAMARLARLEPGHRVLDPYCGAGTLLVEAHALEPRASYVGLDREPTAIAAARANSADIRWSRKKVDGSFDRIITNPPWGVRLPAGDLVRQLDQWQVSGRLVAIVTHDQAARLSTAWRIEERYDVSVAGQHARIVVAKRPVPD
ncbi:methyltransferase domain-containing protein [Kribbella sp. NPDC026611]|uniref:methyltransferase domain-containing protein n=1 Tax=Kribbella sp. NPDC026611 TaxID=3154911 RepID=UPI0033CDC41B